MPAEGCRRSASGGKAEDRRRTVHLEGPLGLPVFMLILVLISGGFGCGKKGLPSPPRGEAVPAISDLSGDMDGGRVVLTWTVPAAVQQGRFGAGTMSVLRARTDLSDGPCTGCPLVFQQVAAMQVPWGTAGGNPHYAGEVDKGFRYTYKVVLRMDNGRSSAASNLISFDYQEL